jgi:hypothetical protein
MYEYLVNYHSTRIQVLETVIPLRLSIADGNMVAQLIKGRYTLTLNPIKRSLLDVACKLCALQSSLQQDIGRLQSIRLLPSLEKVGGSYSTFRRGLFSITLSHKDEYQKIAKERKLVRTIINQTLPLGHSQLGHSSTSDEKYAGIVYARIKSIQDRTYDQQVSLPSGGTQPNVAGLLSLQCNQMNLWCKSSP